MYEKSPGFFKKAQPIPVKDENLSKISKRNLRRNIKGINNQRKPIILDTAHP